MYQSTAWACGEQPSLHMLRRHLCAALQAWNHRRAVRRVQTRLLAMMRGLLEEVRGR